MPQFHKVDEAATILARNRGQFADHRSYVTTTGCLKLFGVDFSKQCEAVIKKHGNRCYRCGDWRPRHQLEVHHKIHRGQGGADDEANLIPLCAACHRGPDGEHA